MGATNTERVRERSTAPFYLLNDVARYIHVHPSTARSWVPRIPGRESRRRAGTGLSFFDLVSLFVIRQLRIVGVSLKRIRSAERYLIEWFGPYPFAKTVTWTNGLHVLFDPDQPGRTRVPASTLLSADKLGQQASVELLRNYLRSIEYGGEGIAVAWRPTDRVELNPLRQFGRPCVKGTRVDTRGLYLMYKAGELPVDIANAFDIAQRDVIAALGWEEGLLKKVA